MNNDTEAQKKNIKQMITERITRGEVIMRSKSHFIFRWTLLIVGAVFVFLVLVYLLSFVLFSLRYTGLWYTPGFGFQGVGVFFAALPWILILFGIALFAVLEFLVKKYSFAYRRPLLYSIVGIIALSLMGGFVLERSTSIHEHILEGARAHRIPIVGPVYRQYGLGFSTNVHPGVVAELEENGFLMRSRGDEDFTVIFTPETRFPTGNLFVMGDLVVVFGEVAGHSIEAIGIKKIDDEFERPVPGPRRIQVYIPNPADQ